MKTTLTILLMAALQCSAAVNQFDLGTLPPDPWPAQNAAIIAARGNPPPDPWREINGVTYSVRGPGFKPWYDKTDSRMWSQFGSKAVFSDGWFVFNGEVIEVQTQGIRIRGRCNYFGTNAAKTVFFIINYPYQTAVGDILDWHVARQASIHTYDTVMGSSMSLRRFDYGLVTTAPLLPPASEGQQASWRAVAAQKKIEAQASVLKFQQENAAAGDSYCQRKMGERFRDGDGVTKDSATAKTWLAMAAAQGDDKARRELNDLNVTAAK